MSTEPRPRIVVDTETTGLRTDVDVAVEVAWWDQATGERGEFVPVHDEFDMDQADPGALLVNNYWMRGLDNPQTWDWSGAGARRLHEVLADATWAGSNPGFDLTMLRPVFRRSGLPVDHHHHRLDALESVARGRLGLPRPIGAAEVARRLGVAEQPDHTAAGDVTVIGRCFELLDDMPLLVLDPGSDDDVARLVRAVLAIPDHQQVRAKDIAHGRRLLQKLSGGRRAA
nr:exonuclease domain-containing protein [Pseudonocardia sp. AL041005-10]